MLHKIIYLFLLTFVIVSCSEDESNSSIGKVTHFSECKSNSRLLKSSTPSNQTCVIYSYNGSNKLLITHINAGFNCCPKTISADIKKAGRDIVITEKEEESACSCLCLFDVDFEVNNITPGNYSIIFVEPYAEQGPPIEFDANLTTARTDTLYFSRNYYPWGV
ncbi:MAG: hypothetical protein V1773_12415 [bacterium]